MEKIVKDENSAIAAKTRQNYDAPISRLPNEILIHIFAMCQSEVPIVLWEDAAPLRLWHKVTHVCQHWRHVALHAASLWTEPPTHLHNYTLLMLKRSQQSALSIYLNCGTSKATKAAVFKHQRRIHRLTLDLYKKGLNEIQGTLLCLSHDSFLQLRELTIDGNCGVSHDPFKLSTSTFRHASSLKSLWLREIDFDWQLFPISTLTSLHLYDLRVSVGPSWKQFQNMLRRMPQLESLLFSFDDLRIHTPPSNPDPLHLPALSNLEICQSNPWVTQAFINGTQLAQQLRRASITCSFNDDNRILHNYSPIVRAVLSLYAKGNFGPFKTLHVAEVQFWVSPNEDADEDDDDCADKQELHLMILRHYRAPVPVESECGRLANDVMSEIAVLPGNPGSNIVHLSVSMDFSPHQFLALFGHLPRLETISSAYFSSLPIIESLEISPLHPPGSPIPFAKLNAITLDKWGSRSDYSLELLEKLIDCLMMRCEYGAGVEYLFVGWKLTTKEVQRLQEIVVDVKVKDYPV